MFEKFYCFLASLALVGTLSLTGCGEAVVEPAPPVPDRIGFVVRDPVTRISSLYVGELSGKKLTKISNVAAPTSSIIAISNDGRYLFYTGKNGSELPLMMVDTRTATFVQLSERSAAYPTLSADRQRVAWFESKSAGYVLMMCYLDGTSRTMLVSSVDAPIVVQGAPAWSPDGSQIAYNIRDTTATTSVVIIPCVIDVQTRNVVRYPVRSSIGPPQFLTSDTLVYLVAEGSQSSLRRLALDSLRESVVNRLPLPQFSSFAISVSPDHSTVVCSNPLVVINLAEGTHQTVPSMNASVHSSMWARDGASFVVGDKTTAALYSDRLFRYSKIGAPLSLPSWDSLGSSACAVWLR